MQLDGTLCRILVLRMVGEESGQLGPMSRRGGSCGVGMGGNGQVWGWWRVGEV